MACANFPDGSVIAGLFAAVATPVHGDGRVDFRALDRLVDFVVEAGASGICLAGATGEYPHFETADRKAIIRRAAKRLPRDRALLVGIGAPSMRHAIEIGETAIESGSRALLLPMPMFFRYEQQDLETFCAHVSGVLRAPCLLYNLPEFTNGLAPVRSLMTSVSPKLSADPKPAAKFAAPERSQSCHPRKLL